MWLTWMVEEVRKTQLLLDVASLGGQQLGLRAQESRRSLRWKRVVVGKVKGTDETVAVGGGQSSEMEGGFLVCEVGRRKKSRDP